MAGVKSIGRYKDGENSLDLWKTIGSWFGLNMSQADLQAADLNEEMAMRADERAFQYEMRGLRESPEAQIEGFQNAGLNPAMLYGSTNPTYANGQGTAPTAVNNTSQGLGAVLAPLVELAQARSVIDANRSRAWKDYQDGLKSSLGNKLTIETWDSLVETATLEPQKLRSAIDSAIADAKDKNAAAELKKAQAIVESLNAEQLQQMIPLLVASQTLQNAYQEFKNKNQQTEFDKQMRILDEQANEIAARAYKERREGDFAHQKNITQVVGGLVNNLIDGGLPPVPSTKSGENGKIYVDTDGKLHASNVSDAWAKELREAGVIIDGDENGGSR